MRLVLLLCLLAAGVARATSVVPPRFDELVAEAELIVRATPIARETRRETAPDGTAILRTYVTLAVERTLKGAAADRLTLAFLGGERLGAATWGEPRWATALALAVAWGAATPLLFALADRLGRGRPAGYR